jgi:hypothetical protein
LQKVALVAAVVVAVLGLAGPAPAHDGWNRFPPPGFPAPPSISLFVGNTPPMFRPQPYPVYVEPPRRYCPPRRVRYGYAAPGYGYGYDHGRGKRHGNRVIIVER